MLSRYLLVAALSATALGFVESSVGNPCGLKIAPCSEDTVCVPDSPDCKDLNRCLGTCQFKNTYKSCGGMTPTPVTCPEGTECIDDPRFPDSCGMACDAPGICAPEKKKTCSGFLGTSCPEGLYCYDIPKDGCDVKKGGADCLGICM